MCHQIKLLGFFQGPGSCWLAWGRAGKFSSTCSPSDPSQVQSPFHGPVCLGLCRVPIKHTGDTDERGSAVFRPEPSGTHRPSLSYGSVAEGGSLAAASLAHELCFGMSLFPWHPDVTGGCQRKTGGLLTRTKDGCAPGHSSLARSSAVRQALLASAPLPPASLDADWPGHWQPLCVPEMSSD